MEEVIHDAIGCLGSGVVLVALLVAFALSVRGFVRWCIYEYFEIEKEVKG